MDNAAHLPLFMCFALIVSGIAALGAGLMLNSVPLATGALVMLGAGGFGAYVTFEVFR